MATTGVRGRDLTILAGDGGGPPEVFTVVAQATVHEWTIDNTLEEVNTKDSLGWRDLFPAGSIKSIEATMTFLFKNSAEQARIRTLALSDTPAGNFRLRDGSGDDLLGEFQISNYRPLGEVNGFEQVNVTLSSNGIVTTVPEV